MRPLEIIGWGVLCSAGVGQQALAEILHRRDGGTHLGVELKALGHSSLPSSTAHALPDFDVRHWLGRKGTSFLDRRSALAMVACGQAIEDAALTVDDGNRQRVGIALGTTWGSLKSMVDYTLQTLTEERPYLVNPILFPNTVMNCAAGQAAIRYGARGVNATLAGGQMAFLHVLRYTANVLFGNHADTMLAGSVEEFTPHSAWAAHLLDNNGRQTPAGEGAAVFVMQRVEESSSAAPACHAHVLATAVGFAPGGEAAGAIPRVLEGCIRSALMQANASASDLITILTTETLGNPSIEECALTAVFGRSVPPKIVIRRFLGECHAATGALQLAVLMSLHREDASRDGSLSLMTAWTQDGSVGAAVVRGWRRGGPHRK
jgi:3-oxoacyl-[acyl-carrier-protein] synthase II